MANVIDDLLDKQAPAASVKSLKLTGDKPTNKQALVQVLINAGLAGDTKSAIYLLDNCTKQTKNKLETPLDKARNGRKKNRKANTNNTHSR